MFLSQLQIYFFTENKLYPDLQPVLRMNYLQQLNMKNIILVLALAYLTISTVVIQSSVGDLITSYNPPHKAVLNTYPYNVSISQAPGAVWIWAKNWDNYKSPSPITISKQFYASCGCQMTLYATANHNFTVTINGNVVLSGSDWMHVYSITFKPLCGLNTFSITAQNCGTYIMKPAGILYAIVQDTSNCYYCPVGQTWDPMTCSCICADHCDCVLPQIFFGFPTCQCGCIQTVPCASNYYFDQNCCSCKCLPLACDWAHIFDEASCSCICPKTLWCEMGYIFSDITCTCIKISIPGESSSCESSSEENWGAGPV